MVPCLPIIISIIIAHPLPIQSSFVSLSSLLNEGDPSSNNPVLLYQSTLNFVWRHSSFRRKILNTTPPKATITTRLDPTTSTEPLYNWCCHLTFVYFIRCDVVVDLQRRVVAATDEPDGVVVTVVYFFVTFYLVLFWIDAMENGNIPVDLEHRIISKSRLFLRESH